MKIGNAILSLIGLLYVIWLSVSKESIPDMGFTHEQQIRLGFLIITWGLFEMAFSEEKIDDERVQEVRKAIMRIFLRSMLAVLLMISLWTVTETGFDSKNILNLTLASLILYHIAFNAALYLNPSWITTEPKFTPDKRIQPKFYLILTIVFAIFAALVFWLNP